MGGPKWVDLAGVVDADDRVPLGHAAPGEAADGDLAQVAVVGQGGDQHLEGGVLGPRRRRDVADDGLEERLHVVKGMLDALDHVAMPILLTPTMGARPWARAFFKT